MSVLSDRWIKKMALEKEMIKPFVSKQKRGTSISYGLSSFGYDARVSNEFKIFTDVDSVVVDPKNFKNNSFVSRKGDESWLSVTPDSSGIIGIHFVPFPLFFPKYRSSGTTIFTAAIQFILINIMTFAGSLLCYEFIIKRVKWLRLFFGLKIK